MVSVSWGSEARLPPPGPAGEVELVHGRIRVSAALAESGVGPDASESGVGPDASESGVGPQPQQQLGGLGRSLQSKRSNRRVAGGRSPKLVGSAGPLRRPNGAGGRAEADMPAPLSSVCVGWRCVCCLALRQPTLAGLRRLLGACVWRKQVCARNKFWAGAPPRHRQPSAVRLSRPL